MAGDCFSKLKLSPEQMSGSDPRSCSIAISTASCLHIFHGQCPRGICHRHSEGHLARFYTYFGHFGHFRCESLVFFAFVETVRSFALVALVVKAAVRGPGQAPRAGQSCFDEEDPDHLAF